MKLNRFKLQRNLTTLYWLSAIEGLLLLLVFGVGIYNDSITYLNAWTNCISCGTLASRTPVYPIFLGVINSIFGNVIAPYIVISLQYLIFLISIKCFYRSCRSILKSANIAYWLTAFYALFPSFTSWEISLLTEGLAISGSVFLLYSLLKFKFNKSWIHVFLVVWWTVFLIFLRPVFVYLLPLMIVVFLLAIFFYRNLWKQAICGMIGILLICTTVFSYMKKYESQYGLFSLSDVSVLNQFFMARQYGVLKVGDTDNTRFNQYLKESISKYGEEMDSKSMLWAESGYVGHNFDLKELNGIVAQSTQKNKSSWIKGLLRRCYDSAGYTLFKVSIQPVGFITTMFGLNIGLLNILLVILIIMIVKAYKRGESPWVSMSLLMLIASNLIVIEVGAQEEWSRLLLPSTPYVLLVVGIIYERIINDKLLSIKKYV